MLQFILLLVLACFRQVQCFDALDASRYLMPPKPFESRLTVDLSGEEEQYLDLKIYEDSNWAQSWCVAKCVGNFVTEGDTTTTINTNTY